jgi:ADP-ribosyl-[dinitrogen reductase] hydrolase
MAGDHWLSDDDLAVLARLVRRQNEINGRPAPLTQPVSVHRVELSIGVDADGRRFLVRDPVEAADAEVLRPAAGTASTTIRPPEPKRASGPSFAERWRGCLLAGAIGDALGAPIESKPIERIREVGTPFGITDFVPHHDGIGSITDDTQMTLFTAEALIRAHATARRTGETDVRYALQHGYQRWLFTQGVPWEKARGPERHDESPGGWLVTVPGLHRRRAPGATCFFALKEYGKSGTPGTFTHTLNNSKGCGGIMRAAPVALWSDDPAELFETGAVSAALTHSHPSGYLPAGAHAVLVGQLLRGVALPDAIGLVRELLPAWNGHQETLAALDSAVALAEVGAPSPERVATLGGGNVGETALAIAVYAALVTTDPNAALLVAVNHSGDSDSTGAVCGNLAGALYAEGSLEKRWLERLELREVIETVASDALAEFGPEPPLGADEWFVRYPAD